MLSVGKEDSTQARLALEQLCRNYWYPLYAYVRRHGYTEHDAQDLIQGFFAVLLKRQALHKLVPGRGKFRSFLLTALNHFLQDEQERQQAQKRGGGQSVVSLDAQDAEQKDAIFGLLSGYIVEGEYDLAYAEVAPQLGMNEEAVKKAVQRLRRRYSEASREEIAQTVTTAAEVEEELRHLALVLSS